MSRTSTAAAERAFSLIEMIAVVAILSILAAALLPRWIKRIDMAAQKEEALTLGSISNALVSQVVRGSALPNETTWSQTVAGLSALPLPKVTSNARRYPRVYFLERDANPSASPPEHLRAMVISILSGDSLDASNCPKPGGGTLDPADFDHLWSLPRDTRPTANQWANWKGQGDDFLVQRIDYRPLFYHLVLLNRGKTNDTPAFSINDTATQTILRTANNAGWSSYCLRGTVLGLYDTATQPVTRYILQQDIGFVWEGGRWRAEIMGAPGSQTVSVDFADKAMEFLEAARYGKASGANQEGVVTTMYDFMLSYTYWAEECPRFNTHGVSAQQVAEYRILTWVGANNGLLDVFSKNLVTK